jgi:hypothetical protein
VAERLDIHDTGRKLASPPASEKSLNSFAILKLCWEVGPFARVETTVTADSVDGAVENSAVSS